ncbi:hypothetical protein NE452_17980, partial [Paeniclostridium sordellii]|nr:hypothetical protein [Paeniclostridium sordellii]
VSGVPVSFPGEVLQIGSKGKYVQTVQNQLNAISSAYPASNKYYEQIVPIIEEYMEKMGQLTGRPHGLFDYFGPKDAKYIIVAMGSVTETIEETITYLNSK